MLSLVIIGLIAYAGGYKANVETSLLNPSYLADQVTQSINFVELILSFVGILLVTHEYRYNTILYTFTSSSSRLKVLFAKLAAVSAFSIVASLVFGALTIAFTYIGVKLAGNDLAPQHFDAINVFARVAFGGWGFSMFALILALIIRSQVGAIAAIFLIPSTLEPILGIFLKKNQEYLPFTALSGVLAHANISYSRAALVSLIYVAVGLVVAAILFTRRDAN